MPWVLIPVIYFISVCFFSHCIINENTVFAYTVPSYWTVNSAEGTEGTYAGSGWGSTLNETAAQFPLDFGCITNASSAGKWGVAQSEGENGFIESTESECAINQGASGETVYAMHYLDISIGESLANAAKNGIIRFTFYANARGNSPDYNEVLIFITLGYLSGNSSLNSFTPADTSNNGITSSALAVFGGTAGGTAQTYPGINPVYTEGSFSGSFNCVRVGSILKKTNSENWQEADLYTKQMSFKIERVSGAPAISYTSPESGWAASKSSVVTFTETGSGISRVTRSCTGVSPSAEPDISKAASSGGVSAQYTTVAESNGIHTFYLYDNIGGCVSESVTFTNIDTHDPVITIVSQSSNDIYAKTKSAELSFSDTGGAEGANSGICNVKMDGVSLGAVSTYSFSVNENKSVVFTAEDNAGRVSQLTVNFTRVNTTTVTVLANIAGAQVSGAGLFTGGEYYNITASAVSGYYFTGWTYTGTTGGSLAYFDNTLYTGEPETSAANYEYTANYEEITVYDEVYTYYAGTEERTVSFTPVPGFSFSAVYTYETDGNLNIIGQTVSAPALAGIYSADITVTCAATSEITGVKTVAVTINKGVIDTVTLPPGEWTYDKTVHSLVLSGSLPDGTAASVTQILNNAAVNAGVTQVTAYIDGGNNYFSLVINSTITINPYPLTAEGSFSYVFDGAIKVYSPSLSPALPGDVMPEFTYVFENNKVPLFAGRYTAVSALSSNPNYTVGIFPEGYHITITVNNNFSAKRIITPAGERRILLTVKGLTGDAFMSQTDNNLIYSVNGSSYYPLEPDRYTYMPLFGGTVEITYMGRADLNPQITDLYYFQIGVDDGIEYNDSTTFTDIGSSLADGIAPAYYSSGTAISTAGGLKTFLQGTGNGYLTNNIYGFDWGGGGCNITFTAGRVFDGNGFTVFLTGDYNVPEMTQPANSFTSYKAWKASGLFVGINEGVIQNVCFRYEGSRVYPSDTYNSANSGRAIGFVSGANSGTIRNTVIALAGNFEYRTSLGVSFGFLAAGGLAGVAYNNSTIVNCTVEHISGTYSFYNHANNTKTYLAFGGGVGFMNGSGNTVKTNGYYSNASMVNCTVKGNLTNIVLECRYNFGGGLIGCSQDAGSNYSAGIIDGVINSYSGKITASTIGYNGSSQKNIGMVGGFVTNLYNVYNTYSYVHQELTGLTQVPSIVSIGRGTGYFHVVAFTGTQNSPISWGNFPANLISLQLPSVRLDTSVTPNVPMGIGFIGYYFEKLNDGNKGGRMATEIISALRFFIWDVKGTSQQTIYTIEDLIPVIIDNEDLEANLIERWVYYQDLGYQIVLDVSFGTQAYGTVDGVVNGAMELIYNGRNQRENVLEQIRIKDEDGNPLEGYELIVNAPYTMKDAGDYVVTFINILSGSSGGDGFVFDPQGRVLIFFSSLNEESTAILVTIEPKDCHITEPFPEELTREYDGTDCLLYYAQFYLEGFTEVISEGEISPLSIKFTFDGINIVTNAPVTASLVYEGDPDSIIPANYNLTGNVSFTASITPRIVTINIPFVTGELPYDYCSKIYDGTADFVKVISLNNAVLPLDSSLYVQGHYYETSNLSQTDKNASGTKTLIFALYNNPYGNYEIISEQKSFATYISKKLLNITYKNTNQSYRAPRVDVTAEIPASEIASGDTVNAYVSMEGIAVAHNTYTAYNNIIGVIDNGNYYIDPDNTFNLVFRYFYYDETNLAFKIETVFDLVMLNSAEEFNDYLLIDYILINDIDNENNVFEMINTYGGNFNGNGKTVKNIVLLNINGASNPQNYACLALFKEIAEGGAISNLTVADTSVNNYCSYVITAGIAAVNYGLITNCYFEGEIYSGTAGSVYGVTGGIAGISYGGINGCGAAAVIVCLGDNAVTGGIAGRVSGDTSQVTNCAGFAEISLTAASASAGGVTGENNSALNTISGNTYLAGASVVNGVLLNKATGNGAEEAGSGYSAICAADTFLAQVIKDYRIKDYLTLSDGTVSDKIKIYNIRQTVLLYQFKWADFELCAGISYFYGYSHTPDTGVFSGSFSSRSGYSYAITLPPETPAEDKTLFETVTGTISVSIL